jgi:hypothetical protein
LGVFGPSTFGQSAKAADAPRGKDEASADAPKAFMAFLRERCVFIRSFAGNYVKCEMRLLCAVDALLSTGQVGTFPTISTVDKETYNQSNTAFGLKYNFFRLADRERQSSGKP